MTDNPIDPVRDKLKDGKNWVKGSYHSGVFLQNHCLVGAIEAAHEMQYARVETTEVIQRTISQLYPHCRFSIVGFNDDRRTTWPMVAKVLDVAAENWDKAHQPIPEPVTEQRELELV